MPPFRMACKFVRGGLLEKDGFSVVTAEVIIVRVMFLDEFEVGKGLGEDRVHAVVSAPFQSGFVAVAAFDGVALAGA